MSLSSRRIAVQGLGAGALFVALQGLVQISQVEPSPPFVGASGGGGQISQSEWLRRRAPLAGVDQVVLSEPIDQAKAARDAMRKRRKRQEVLLLLS